MRVGEGGDGQGVEGIREGECPEWGGRWTVAGVVEGKEEAQEEAQGGGQGGQTWTAWPPRYAPPSCSS